jgi:hypothetical protein
MSTLTAHLMTASMLIEQFPAIKLRTLKHWLQVDPDDFRARCVVKVGKKIFYDLDAIEIWLLEHKEPGKGED